ncbi:MAG: gamma-glutamyl-gamma-aminobutyrate hydrolase family protein [Phototrophicaceae bacterium]
MRQPLIGITTYGRAENHIETKDYRAYYFTPTDYVDAIRAAGAVAVLLAPGTHVERATLEAFSGFVVIGGTDIYPGRYNGNVAHEKVLVTDHERDQFELSLIHYAKQYNIPTLCICRGMQALNVAHGGTLIEHLMDEIEVDIHGASVHDWLIHPVEATPHSRVQQAMGTTTAQPYSAHHQAVKTLGQDLEVTALAPDGIIEAIECTDQNWMVGVQWHPEKSAADDPTQQGLFNMLVQQARTR